MKAKTEYNIGDVVKANLGTNENEPIELKISAKETSRIGVSMYGFEGKGDVRCGANFILDEKLGRYPKISECLDRTPNNDGRLSNFLSRNSKSQLRY